jgi:DNA-binding NtrC family response regulator
MPESRNIKILVCDDDETLCYLLKEQLLEEGFSVETVYDGKYAIENLRRKSYDVLLLDLQMKEVSGEEVLKFARDYDPTMSVIMMTAKTETRIAIEMIKLGAYDFIPKPYDFDDLLLTINRAIDLKHLVVENKVLSNKVTKKIQGKIVGESPELQRTLNLAIKSAASGSNILIEGETGTGKELFAEYIHRRSNRKDKPFVIINCASLPDQLIESELFGYEKGAFTDAKSTKQGLVEIAHGGTLFLDEIGEMSLSLQPKLLRFLENGEYRRIGGVASLTSNVRVIGATNKNLLDEAEKKNFRRDLLFRLNIITIRIPPLRDRRSDIIRLANYFLQSNSPVRSPKRLSVEAENALLNYSFPGNVRELEHIIERAIIFAEGEIIDVEDLNLPLRLEEIKGGALKDETVFDDGFIKMDDVERAHILKILNRNSWNREKTALMLEISQKTLYTKIKKYNLRKNGQNE